MLQNKGITKIQEIKTLYTDKWIQPDFFSQQLELFKFTKTMSIFNSVKKNGICVWDLLKVLFVLPFTNTPNVFSLLNSKMALKSKGKKDAYYRLLANQNINWRNVLFLFVKRYIKLDQQLNETNQGHKCLIFDDTKIAKSGRTIEGISKIYDHASHNFLFGYKLLVAGYWNGSVFIPIDFSFHRENKNNKSKKYGLSKKETKKQKRTKREKGSPVIKRFKELNSKKNDIILDIFKRVNQRKIDVEYILIDSWFTSLQLISKLKKINADISVIGMYKYNSKVNVEGNQKSIKQLRKSKKGLKYSRSTGLYHMSIVGEIDGIKCKIFLIRRGKRGAWHTILSTDTTLAFNSMIKIYNIRWTIEVFFKEAKQLLGLGKCQSTNFDVQIAQTTITMIQYLMMSLKYQMEAYQTIGGLFKDVKQDYIDYKLNERIMMAIVEILVVLENLGVQFDYEITISRLIEYNQRFGNQYGYRNSEDHWKSCA